MIKTLALTILLACTPKQAPPQDASQDVSQERIPALSTCDLSLSRGDGVILAAITTRCEVGRVSAWLWVWGDDSQQVGATRDVVECNVMTIKAFPFDLIVSESVHGLALLTDADTDTRCENRLY